METCRLCREVESSAIWSCNECRVILVNDPELPGFCRVIWHQHVAEMSALDSAQRDLLMRVVIGVEEAVSQCMAPTKINLASLGNQVPHLHWHVIPRYGDDSFFPDSIWSARKRDTPEEVLEVRRRQAARLPELIRSAGRNWV